MVKNETGGKRSKQVARKTVEKPQTSQRVRYVEEPGEMYAIVTAKFGGRNIQVMCHDGVSRRCVIRNKFMKLKGDNSISIGSWLMVGIYEWEKRVDCTQTCDVLEIYLRAEKEKIKQNVNISVIKHIIEISNEMEGNKKGNELIFSETLDTIPEQENIHLIENTREDKWWVPKDSDSDEENDGDSSRNLGGCEDGGKDGGDEGKDDKIKPYSDNLSEATIKQKQNLYKEKDFEKTMKIKESRKCKTETTFINEDDI
jgi:hypothetical protein